MTTLDRLSPVLSRFRVQAHLFHAGPLCGVTTFSAEPGRAFLHVLREGEMQVRHAGPDGSPSTVTVDRPTLLFYPRPVDHAFVNAPTEDSDFACATVRFSGGEMHPLVRSLPPVIVLPLDAVDGLDAALGLLFAELDAGRCGSPILADRLFDVVVVQLLRWMLDHTADLALPPGLLTGFADERLAATLTAVHDRPGDPWTLESMAREASMSRSSFAARFKQVVGRTPGDYLTDWRILVAQDRLRAGDPVTRTATDLGYATAPAFSRAFSQRVGCSPRAWLATQG